MDLMTILNFIFKFLLFVFGDVRHNFREMLSKLTNDWEMSELAWHLSIFVKILNVKNMFGFLAEKFQKLLKFLFFHNFAVLNYVDNALSYVAFLQVLSQNFMLHRLKQSSHVF